MRRLIVISVLIFNIMAFATQRYEYRDRVKLPFVECEDGKTECLNNYQKLNSLLFALGCFGTDDDVDPDGFIIQKFGRSASLPNGEWATVYDANDVENIYPILDTEETMYIISSSSRDSAEIRVYYLDGDYNRQKVDVTLNGDTEVLVADDVMRPYRMKIIDNKANVGDIDLVNASDVVYARIIDSGEGFNQTQMAVYTIPAGYTGIVTSINAGVGSSNLSLFSAGVELHYKVKKHREANKTKIPLILYQSNYYEQFSIPHIFPEKTYLNVQAKAGAANITATARFYIYLIKTDILNNICSKINF